ncbi:PREDICTED: protein SOX-15-like isoform X2 [Wasmannia auropunctata]|uniref:protein SOX-15-like isoform X2 n=1 Tax=Wasmannia auropunctata TaxID=64793 RepID=UPI0005F04A56|nr:PREDICTED: protein SOX-15-like isoform X2 [Wasmannia auropunctata]
MTKFILNHEQIPCSPYSAFSSNSDAGRDVLSSSYNSMYPFFNTVSSDLKDDTNFIGQPPKEKEHVKRPMNAFFLWAQQKRREISQENPKMHNSQISKILSEKWKKLTDEDKVPYINRAKCLRVQHQKDHPDYKFLPRKKPRRKILANQFENMNIPSGTSFPQPVPYVPMFDPTAVSHRPMLPYGSYHPYHGSDHSKVRNPNTSSMSAVSADGNENASLNVNRLHHLYPMSPTVGNPTAWMNPFLPTGHAALGANSLRSEMMYPFTSGSISNNDRFDANTYDTNVSQSTSLPMYFPDCGTPSMAGTTPTLECLPQHRLRHDLAAF